MWPIRNHEDRRVKRRVAAPWPDAEVQHPPAHYDRAGWCEDRLLELHRLFIGLAFKYPVVKVLAAVA
jgi:hypothetical protein